MTLLKDKISHAIVPNLTSLGWFARLDRFTIYFTKPQKSRKSKTQSHRYQISVQPEPIVLMLDPQAKIANFVWLQNKRNTQTYKIEGYACCDQRITTGGVPDPGEWIRFVIDTRRAANSLSAEHIHKRVDS